LSDQQKETLVKSKTSKLYDVAPEEAGALALQEYMGYVAPIKIIKTYGIPRWKMDWWIYQQKGSWKKLRETIENKTINKVVAANKKVLDPIIKMSGKLVLQGLARYEKIGVENLTVEDLAKISTIMTNVKKMLRLENNQPTEITEERKIDTQSIRRVIKEIGESDPYCTYGEEKGPGETVQ